jgi:uncharacterized membrane protein YadS
MIVLIRRNQYKVQVSSKANPLIPGFLIAFIVLVLLATAGVIPAPTAKLAGEVSRGLLVTAIAAAGIKTSFEDLVKLGWQPVVMMVGETLFIATFVLLGLKADGFMSLVNSA